MGKWSGSRRPFPRAGLCNEGGSGKSNPRSSGVLPHLILSLPDRLGHGGWSWGPETAPGVLLPEGLPAVLFHVVFWTFTFKGGDEES